MNIKKAKAFLETRLDSKVIKTYRQHGFSLNGMISSNDWEVFAAILFDETKKASGSDLQNYEVKSAGEGGSFEYQYHKKSGLNKIKEDKRVKHVFITYSKEYKNISVRIIEGKQLTEKFFDVWEKGIKPNYATGSNKRYRKRISSGFVKKHGRLILEINNEE